MTTFRLTKEQKGALVREHARSRDVSGWLAVCVTLVPLAVLWWLAAQSLHTSGWITAALIPPMTVLMIRVFSLMHECGHGSLFRTQALNRGNGFILGVISGMPQFVWSQHHNYHHQTNGNWDKYRGPVSTLSVAEYAALSPGRQRFYGFARQLVFAPLGGFVYLLWNPRVNWIRGSLALAAHVLAAKLRQPRVSCRAHAATFATRLWKSPREYWHMSANNLVLLSLWTLGCWALGPLAFFAIYVTSVSLAGGVGIALFTVQHNFEDSYASADPEWTLDAGAFDGTSYLVLPAWLNWATANIGYHHIHHLSAAIPGYCLPRCHAENEALFAGVTRITLAEIPRHLKCILWDAQGRRIISVRDYERQRAAAAHG
jgi:omega-6 fatty acid desaturase (delta-12 desaturase)